MSRKFVLELVLNRIDRDQLEAIFEVLNIEPGFDFKSHPRGKRKNQPWHQIRELSSEQLQKLENVLQPIHSLGKTEGRKLLIDLYRQAVGPTEKIKEFDSLDPHSLAAWFYNTQPKIFWDATNLIDLERSPDWVKRGNYPKCAIMVTDSIKTKLKAETQNLIKQSSHEGGRCVLTYYQCGDRHYLLVHTEGHPDKEFVFVKDDQIEVQHIRPVVLVAFKYNQATGSVEVSTRGHWRFKLQLEKMFAKEVLKTEVKNDFRRTFQLNVFRTLRYLETEKDDHVKADIGSIKYQLFNSRRVNAHTADSEFNDFPLMYAQCVNDAGSRLDTANVQEVVIRFWFEATQTTKKKEAKVLLTTTGWDPPHVTEGQMELIEKYLQKWGICES